MTALPYEVTFSELSNWLVHYEDGCTADFPDSDQDKIRPVETWGKLDSGWQSEILKDSFKNITLERVKKVIRNRHSARFSPQSILVTLLRLLRGGDELKD